MIAFCSLSGRDMSVELAQDVLADLWGEEEKIITIEHIQRKVAEFFGIKLSDMRAKNRTKAVAFPRQIAMYLARQLTHASLAEVGRAFGGKDHTTVLHAVEKIQTLLQDDPKFKKTVDTLPRASPCDPPRPPALHRYPPTRRRYLHCPRALSPSPLSTRPPTPTTTNSSFFSLNNGDLMEVHVDRDAFIRGLQMVHNVVEPRQTLPILANVLLEAQGDLLRMTATDLEVGVRVGSPARVVTPGSVTISARKLMEIMKELPWPPALSRCRKTPGLPCGVGEHRTSSWDWPRRTTRRSRRSRARHGRVAGMELLLETCARAHTFAISHDESRYALNGVLMALRDHELRLVATDSHRLALSVRPIGEIKADVSGIVPRKAVQEIARVVGSGEQVDVVLGDNQFMLRMPNVILMARLIEGTFPNYEQVVPRAHPHRVLLPKDGG